MWNSRQIKWNIALGRLPPAVHSKNRLPGAALTSHVQEFIPAALSPLSPPPLSLTSPLQLPREQTWSAAALLFV